MKMKGEVIRGEMQEVGARMEAAASELKAAEQLLEEAIVIQGNVEEASELYDKAHDAFESAYLTYDLLFNELLKEAQKTLAAQGCVESAAGSVRIGVELGDPDVVASAAEKVVESARNWKEMLETIPALSEEEEVDLGGLFEKLGITDKKNRERMGNRMKVLLGVMDTRNSEVVLRQIEAEGGYKIAHS